MTIQITAVRYSGTYKTHEALSDFRWTNPQTGATGSSDKQTLVAWLDEKSIGNTAYVSNGARQAWVGTVHPQHGQPYLRTHADGVWTDNLLALPTF